MLCGYVVLVQSISNINRVVQLTQNSICCLHSVDTLQNGARVGGDELLNKVIYFFYAYKKYHRSFVKLRLNLLCHIDYFTNVLATFLGGSEGDHTGHFYGTCPCQDLYVA